MFQNPFSFDGRIRRLEYGLSILAYIVFYLIQIALIQAGTVGIIIWLVALVPVLWFLWAQGAKRCHDLGRSGWFQLIPFYGFVMLFSEGDTGMNEYGSNPKDPNQVNPHLDSETLDGHMGNLQSPSNNNQ
jgi:uncharacterized membrane protein YhaH (DUF805 family)